jgi:ribosome-interacting GTPase 1
MQILTTTEARKNIKELVNGARYQGNTYAIGRRNSIDALLIGFPAAYSSQVNDITNINTYSKSFDFLAEEPDMYSVTDLKKRYA